MNESMLAKGQGLVKDSTKVMNVVDDGHSGAVSEEVVWDFMTWTDGFDFHN